jgi:methionyl-tRNA synthetase
LLDRRIDAFEHLLKRVDAKALRAILDAGVELPDGTTPAAQPRTETIRIDDFAKVDLRVARIVDAAPVEGSDKLLELRVDLGSETRTVLAGIKSAYTPEQLVGRLAVMVANLAPRKMRFGTSEGMILAAGPGGEDIWLLQPDEGARPGDRIQ